MTAPWLVEVSAALDRIEPPCPFFFRDDGAGWEDERLFDLFDCLEARQAALDVAVIPTETCAGLARELRARAAGGAVRLHQHGYAHQNHEPAGRSCELGPTRPPADQWADIVAGRDLLLDAFGASGGPRVHVPLEPVHGGDDRGPGHPRVRGAVPRRHGGAVRPPRPVRGSRHGRLVRARRGVRWTPEVLAGRLGGGVVGGGPVGVMLHHALMDDDERAALDELLALVASHDGAFPTTLSDLATRSRRRRPEPPIHLPAVISDELLEGN